jgi:hypothetical protein
VQVGWWIRILEAEFGISLWVDGREAFCRVFVLLFLGEGIWREVQKRNFVIDMVFGRGGGGLTTRYGFR